MNCNQVFSGLESTRNCTRCKGEGINKAILGAEGQVIIAERQCYSCKGQKVFNCPDFDVIVDALKGRKGIRTAKPKNNPRAAYVWRMFRFHGGIDVTMPMMALLDITGDPYEKELDTLASALAKAYRGTDLAGASRWASALGYTSSVPYGLPVTAYSGGPAKE